MGLSLDCHQIRMTKASTVASCECSCHVRFSICFSMIPGARILGMLALVILTLSSGCGHVEGLSFAFSGFAGLSDVYTVQQDLQVWAYNTDNYSLTLTPHDSFTTNVAGRFLYPMPVQMMEPGTTTAKNFSTTFIFQIFLQPSSATMVGGVGPGLAFIIVPDNTTVGYGLDYMGILTTTTSQTSKYYASDNHTFAVELDTQLNPEFNDPNDNHICIDVASLNSTEYNTFKPTILLTTGNPERYQQVWIDYIQANSQMNIYHAEYPQSKPAIPLGSQFGVDLSILKENMYIGFSSSVGIESSNLHTILAWSFSNEGEAPPIKIGRDSTPPAPSPSPPPGAAGSLSRIGVVRPGSPAPPPVLSTTTPTASSGNATTTQAAVAVIFLTIGAITLCCWWKFCRRGRSTPITFENAVIRMDSKRLEMASPSNIRHVLPVPVGPKLRIFISHTAGKDGIEKNFAVNLSEKLKENQCYEVFIDREMRKGIDFPEEIKQEIRKTELAIVVVTTAYFGRKWPMLELVKFMEVCKMNRQAPKVRVLPLFYMLTPKEVRDLLNAGHWEEAWTEVSREGRHAIDVENYRETVRTLCNVNGIEYNYRNRSHEAEYIKAILGEVDKIHIDMRT